MGIKLSYIHNYNKFTHNLEMYENSMFIPTNQNLMNVPKVFEPTNERISVIYILFPSPPKSTWYDIEFYTYITAVKPF